MPTVSTTWPRIVTQAPKRGPLSTICRMRRLPSSGDGSPRWAALSTSNSAAVWSSRSTPRSWRVGSSVAGRPGSSATTR